MKLKKNYNEVTEINAEIVSVRRIPKELAVAGAGTKLEGNAALSLGARAILCLGGVLSLTRCSQHSLSLLISSLAARRPEALDDPGSRQQV